MEKKEKFAPLRIDCSFSDPQRPPKAHEEETPMPSDLDWASPINKLPCDASLPLAALSPEGAQYKLMTPEAIMRILSIQPESITESLDDNDALEMRYRLRNLGLKLATSIARPLKLRFSDQVPIMRSDAPELPLRSTLTLCMYAIAWLVEADAPSQRDLAMIDQWLANYDIKATWVVTAQATMRWLLSRKLVFTRKRKQRLLKLSRFSNRRDQFLEILLALAADGASPKRMKRLETIYELIGLNPADIHADIHRMATTKSPSATKPKASAIIDRNRLQAMSHNTRQAQEILSEVFAQQPEVSQPAPKQPEKEDKMTAILKALRLKGEWERREFDQLSKQYGFTAGALMETLNDMAFEAVDDALIEDEDSHLLINANAMDEMLKLS